jgi:LysM repeat protein
MIVCLSILFSKQSLSHGDLKQKKIVVGQGDTLWNIASTEIASNNYYEGKEIRNVIDQIKEINELKNSSLYVGQELFLYEL